MVALRVYNASDIGLRIRSGPINPLNDGSVTATGSDYLGGNQYIYYATVSSNPHIDAFNYVTYESGSFLRLNSVTYYNDGRLVISMNNMSISASELLDGFSSVLDGADIITGNRHRDVLLGFSGNDVIRGGGGNDKLVGGSGNDRIFGNDGRDFLNGGNGDDILRGGGGNDQLVGGTRNDRLYGDAGSDFLNGGRGRDNLFGGQNSDTFYFERGDGKRDTILDFEVGTDLIEIGNGATSISQLNFEQHSNDVIVRFADVRFTVEDVTVADLNDSDNFVF